MNDKMNNMERGCDESMNILLGIVLNNIRLLIIIIVIMIVLWCNGWYSDGEKVKIIIEIVGIELELECGVVIRDWNL